MSHEILLFSMIGGLLSNSAIFVPYRSSISICVAAINCLFLVVVHFSSLLFPFLSVSLLSFFSLFSLFLYFSFSFWFLLLFIFFSLLIKGVILLSTNIKGWILKAYGILTIILNCLRNVQINNNDSLKTHPWYPQTIIIKFCIIN